MTGLRERKKLATATALSDAALELAAEHGVAGVTVEAIAARADVSVRTFFNYFSAKEEAMVASHRQELALLVEQIGDRPTTEPIMHTLRATAHAFVRAESSRLQRTRRLLRRVGDTPELLSYRLRALAEVERQLAEVIAQRTAKDVHTDPYPRALAAASIAVLSSMLREAKINSRQPDPTQRIDAAYDLLEHGFGSPDRRPLRPFDELRAP